MGLIDAIGSGRVALDTAPFIYFIEEHPQYTPVVEPLFEAIDAGALEAVTTAITLVETLVVPLRLGDRELAERYEELLTKSRGLRLLDLDRALLRAAAEVRAATGVHLPDALQIAGALRAGCTALITNDRRLPTSPALNVIQLTDFLVAKQDRNAANDD